jgi:Leucine-rich repeat (LRR) protein
MISAEGSIDHSNQNFQEIPKTLLAATFKLITGLNLERNYITSIPESFSNCLPALVSFNMSHNKLSSLP